MLEKLNQLTKKMIKDMIDETPNDNYSHLCL